MRLAQLSAAPALHALVLYIPVLHCALREIGSGSACHQRGAQGAGYSVLRPALSQCIYREGAAVAKSYAKHTLRNDVEHSSIDIHELQPQLLSP